MTIDRRNLLRTGMAAALSSTVGSHARAQAQTPAPWPARFVRLIVPFAAGGANEAFARNLAARLSEIWGQQVVIENKPGAGGNIGADAAARADPDGYTMLIASFPHAVARFLYPALSYDLVAGFAPVTLIGLTPNIMVVPNSSPARSVTEFIAHAKASKVTFASSGVGTSIHLSGELFKRVAGIEMTHVPYRGVALALNDVIPGRVDVMFNTMAGVLQQARSGQLRGLAVTTPKRFPTAPEFPTVADFVPGFDVSSWYAFLVPVKTPAEIVKKLHADTIAILREPAIKSKLEQWHDWSDNVIHENGEWHRQMRKEMGDKDYEMFMAGSSAYGALQGGAGLVEEPVGSAPVTEEPPAASSAKATESAPVPNEVPESIPAGPSARPTAAQQRSINEMGEAHGCSTCPAKTPGTKSGNWVGDHQPSTSVNPPGNPQTYRPQCLPCSLSQGGQLRAAQAKAAAAAARAAAAAAEAAKKQQQTTN